jgi:centrosomal protein CEP152
LIFFVERNAQLSIQTTRDVNVSQYHKSDEDEDKQEKVSRVFVCANNVLKFFTFCSDQLKLSGQDLKKESSIGQENLQHDLFKAHKEIEALEEKLKLKQLRDEELETLKNKAQQFEVFMRTNTRSVDSSCQTSSSNIGQTQTGNQSIETLDYDYDSRDKMRKVESAIRDEMAKIFATEIKSIEQKFRNELELSQHRVSEFKNKLEETSQELTARKEQVKLLKFTIMEERQESSIKSKLKDEYLSETIKKNLEELNDKKALMKEERLSIEQLRKQIKEDKEALSRREQEDNILQHKTTQVIKDLNDKYHLARRTALNYKKYSEDKEAHFRSEYERTKAVYLETVSQVKAELKETNKSNREMMKKMQAEFQFKIEMLKGMLEKN